MQRETYKGDCRHVLATIKSESIDGIFTDPPFNIDLDAQRKTHGKIINDALPPEEFRNLINHVTSECFRVLRPDRAAWFCCNWNCYVDIEVALKKANFEIANCVVWVKHNWGLGYHFRPQHEFILVGFKGNPPVPTSGISNVWQVERLTHTIHPNEKPVKLVQMALSRYNKEGDVILDPFAGSFSTCVAAKNLDMGYIAIEETEHWYNEGRLRLEQGYISTFNAKGIKVDRERGEGNPLLDILK